MRVAGKIGRRRTRVHPLQVAVAVIALLSAGPLTAQEQGPFNGAEPTLGDAAYLATVTPLTIFLMNTDPRPGEIKPGAIDVWAREALVWSNPGLGGTLSDVLLFSFTAAALVSPPLANLSFDDEDWAGTVIAFEAMASAALLSGIFKHLIGRQRPDAFYSGGEHSYSSFFSGHATSAFAAATMLTVFAYEYDWLGDDTRWIVPATSYTLAAFTGYLRTAGDRHWLTDVLVGALVGTSVSYLTYTLRAD